MNSLYSDLNRTSCGTGGGAASFPLHEPLRLLRYSIRDTTALVVAPLCDHVFEMKVLPVVILPTIFGRLRHVELSVLYVVGLTHKHPHFELYRKLALELHDIIPYRNWRGVVLERPIGEV